MPDGMIPLDVVIEPWGRIAAIGVTGGERYYWFVDKDGCVSMIPAFMVEGIERAT